MYVLDTDVLSLVQTGRGNEADRVRSRMRLSDGTDAVTIVTFQEQFRGRLAQCAQATDPDRYVEASRQLRRMFETYRNRTILDFDENAANEFRRLKSLKVRIGTMDLRIAAIVLTHDAMLVTRNRRDFDRVPGLRVEDWTVAE